MSEQRVSLIEMALQALQQRDEGTAQQLQERDESAAQWWRARDGAVTRSTRTKLPILRQQTAADFIRNISKRHNSGASCQG